MINIYLFLRCFVVVRSLADTQAFFQEGSHKMFCFPDQKRDVPAHTPCFEVSLMSSVLFIIGAIVIASIVIISVIIVTGIIRTSLIIASFSIGSGVVIS